MYRQFTKIIGLHISGNTLDALGLYNDSSHLESFTWEDLHAMGVDAARELTEPDAYAYTRLTESFAEMALIAIEDVHDNKFTEGSLRLRTDRINSIESQAYMLRNTALEET
jgi:hypothetical protein